MNKKGKQNTKNMTIKSRKLIKQLIRESKPEPFIINGKTVYFNPLKKLLECESYKSMEGIAVTQEMVKKYEQFLKTRFQQEQLAKANGVDINELDKKEENNGSK